MKDQRSADSQPYLFVVYPLIRRAIYEAFDKTEAKFTRTQQTILVTMSDMGTLSMSALAKKIDTSNEQATRAVTQLVKLGYITRCQNDQNHRIVNISLTDQANELLDRINHDAMDILAAELGKDAFSKLSDRLESAAKVCNK